MMGKPRAVLGALFLCFLCSTTCSSGRGSAVCDGKEKHALLSFKQALIDPENQLSSWSTREDCCGWRGVRCSNVTARVLKLQLADLNLGGEISPALLRLEFLSHLDLSSNYNLGGSSIPSFLGSMRSLRFLDLSYDYFSGLVPPQLGNLSNLGHLNLGYNHLYVENLDWMSRLPSLKYLNMEGVDLHRESHWPEKLSALPSLSELYMPGCHLTDINMTSPLGHAYFSSLTHLDLSDNYINQELPNWLFNLTSLTYLDLSENQFKGQVAESLLGQFKHLQYLDLSSNSFHGPIPTSIGNLSSLELLNLCDTGFNGTVPRSMSRLSNLMALILGDDSLTGAISEEHFTALSKLDTLEISETSLFFNVKSNWTPPFQLQFLLVSSCRMGPKFPAWVRTQKSLSYLDISRSGIMDAVPTWFWEFTSYIQQIHLSNNQISGDLSQVVLNNTIIDLRSNRFSGRLPRLSPNVVVLNIANNSFSDFISPFMCQVMNRASQLEVMSSNALSGELPDCWTHWPLLTHINMGSNNLSGNIPSSMGSLVALRALSLHNNSLSGEVPSSLRNCEDIGLINLSHNKFSGTIPEWIYERTALMVIHLRSNKFHGIIPPQICHLSSLIVLDLSTNGLSGGIPKCLSNLSAMAEGPIGGQYDVFYEALEADYDYESYSESLDLNIKGRDSEYKEILGYVRAIDLSSNNLSGSIPVEMFNLSGLQSLNLSHNNLTGLIPVKIGGMKYLESLDLSRNHLSGEIPQSIVDLTFLDDLTLSYNNLSGPIPSSTQLQSFDPLCFSGNAELCGAPLAKNCTKDDEPLDPNNPIQESGEYLEMVWFYIGTGTGFVVGFWGFCGALLFKKAWRHAYFRFLDDMKDWVYVFIALRLKWFRKQPGEKR